MAYKRRYGRKRRKKRRRKRNNNAKVARIARDAVLRSIGGDRSYIQEDRSLSFANGHGEYSWNTLACVGNIGSSNPGSLKTIIESTGAQDAAALAGDADNAHRRFKVFNFSCEVHLRNLSPHPIFVTLYTVCPKKHVEYLVSGAVCTNHAITKLKDGWAELMDATGDGYLGATSGGSFTTESNYLTPSMSKHFTAFYKVKQKKRFKLNAGDDVFWTVKMPPFTLRPNVFLSTGMTGDDREIDMVKNYTKVVLCKMEGALGHDTADQTVVGPMSCDIAVERVFRAKAYAINSVADGLHMRRTEDLISNLEGPSEAVMLGDD